MNLDDTEAAAHLKALAATASDAFVTIDTKSHIKYVNQSIESILGYTPEELLGEPLTVLMPDGFAEQHMQAMDRYLETGTRHLDWDHVELRAQHEDGHRVPLQISFSEFALDGDRYFTGIIRDVTDQERRTRRLERLNGIARSLSDVETFQHGCERTVAAASELFDFSTAEIALYDTETGTLKPTARASSDDGITETDALFDDAQDLAWEVFVENERREYSNLDAETDLSSADTPLSSALLFPIAGHGVLGCGKVEPGGFDDSTVALTSILVSHVASTFERLDREVSLRGRTSDLESKNEQLQRVQRVNQQIREFTRSLLDAESSVEIKQVVCDRLAQSEPYRFVWFGERDFATDEIEPVAWAGVEDGYLDAITVTADSSEIGQGPAGRAIRENESQVQNDLQADPPFEPWRQEALQRRYRSSISVPVAYNDSVYGILNLYASERGVFSEMEARVLSELGEMVGFALNSRERYDALVSEESVELQFSIQDADDRLIAFLDEHDASFALENVARETAEGLVVVGAFANVPSAALEAFLDRHPFVSDYSVLREREGEVIVEASLRPGSFMGSLLDRSAVPTDIRASGEEIRMTIRTSKAASPRQFVELFGDSFDAVELVARREVDDPVRTSEGLGRAYLDSLTGRQEEVLRTAYYAGFFEQPRANSARDVAELLDVSQPTVSRHIRSAEETLFSLLFGDSGAP